MFLPTSIIKGMLSVGDTPFLSINAIHIGQSLSQLILYLILKIYKKAKVLSVCVFNAFAVDLY
ncbi:hypothetical protein GCM10023142_15890 [Anaerocolumna aminovalerica]